MHRTPFAGITALDQGDSPFDSGAEFYGSDRDTMDRLLNVGAVTHRHDAHDPLADPTEAPSAAVTPSGGAIPADRTIFIGYTRLDNSGGETLLSDVTMESTAPSYDAPDAAPEASAFYDSGALMVGTYYYAITITDGLGGETPVGPSVAATRDPGYASGSVALWGLSDLLELAEGITWRLYRATGGSQFEFLAEGSDDEFVDDGLTPLNCAVQPPSPAENTTGGANVLTVVVPSGSAGVGASGASGSTGFRLYLSEDGAFTDPSLYGTYPMSSAGVAIVIPQLVLLTGKPPLVSTSLPGASKIDPDTELIDWHWKRPVADAASLPVDAEEGDVRVSLATGVPYVYKDGAWVPWDTGGTVGVADGATSLTDVDTITFVGSGGALVGVAAGGTGEAVVTVYASGGGGGGGGASGITVHFGKVAYDGITDLEWAPDGGTVQVNVSDGFATVINKPAGRTETGVGPYTLASGASENAGGASLAPGFRLLRASVDKACRVRIYMNTDDQTNDAARAIGVEPTGDHGLVWEHVFETGDLVRRLGSVIWSSQGVPTGLSVASDDPPGGSSESFVPVSVTNLDTTGDVNVMLVWQQVEAFSP